MPSTEKQETCCGNGGARALGVRALLGGRGRGAFMLVTAEIASAGDDSPSETAERVLEGLRCLDRELVVGEEGGRIGSLGAVTEEATDAVCLARF